MNLDERQEDKLKEIANMGAGKASVALSDLTDQKVRVSYPYMEAIENQDIRKLFGGLSEIKTVVKVDIEIKKDGEKLILGHVLYVLDMKSTHRLSNKLLGEEFSGETEISDEQISALKETTNIITGATVTAMTEWVNIKMEESVPDIAIDMYGAILEESIMSIDEESDRSVVFRTGFDFDEKIDSEIVFLLSEKGACSIVDEVNL